MPKNQNNSKKKQPTDIFFIKGLTHTDRQAKNLSRCFCFFTFNINTFNLYDMTTTRFWGLDWRPISRYECAS